MSARKNTLKDKKNRSQKIRAILAKTYPNAKCALDFANPLQLLVATILSAQCTDVRVNMVTPALFKKYRTAQDFAQADLKTLEQEIHSTGFYKNKARNIVAAAKAIAERHGGQVPNTLEELTALMGVGRKTANVVLGSAYGIPGLTVDTHMLRLNKRLGLSSQTDPVKMEFELMKLVPQKDWTNYSQWIITHGRQVCFARNPNCPACPLNRLCPSRQ